MSLIESLQKPGIFDHPVASFEVLETHISWVLLTGSFAYKIKKPVNFGFVDFSTLEKREHYCREEIRLNRRLAPEIYLDVISIHGTPDHPLLNANTPAIEYAVKMHQFDQKALLPEVLKHHGIRPELIDKLAITVATFHNNIAVVPADNPYGDPEHISEPVRENFMQIKQHMGSKEISGRLALLETWSETQLAKLRSIFQERKSQGYIRECHGDMHLRNMALLDNKIVIFDCIEFNKNFYLIDVMSEIAFLVMDLEDRQQHALARRFLNQYLELTGDYSGLRILNFYKVYRAMVRAKVAALRASQEDKTSPEYASSYRECLDYLALAQSYTKTTLPCLLINHGLSGSGKSFISKQLLEQFPAIMMRSDVERKRIHGLVLKQHRVSDVQAGLYSQEATERTYQHLVSLAKLLLQAGFTVIIDAANLKKSQRQLFISLAKTVARPVVILHYQAGEDVLRQRISRRIQSDQDVSDATMDVLTHQLKTADPLAIDEKSISISIDTEQHVDIKKLIEQITRKIHP